MRSLRRPLLAFAASAAIAATAVLFAPSASAIGCPANTLCAEGNGARGEFQSGVYDLGGFGSGRLNDHVAQINNNTGKTWCLYEHAGYNGEAHVVTSGFNGSPGAFGSRISSMRPRPLFGC